MATSAASAATALPTRNLDILRAVAVSAVLVAHTLKAQGIELPWYLGEKLGGLGVLFFFVHTSLVLLSSLERQGTEVPHWIRAFYVRRAFRIYPLAIATVIAAVFFRMPEHVGIPSVASTVSSARTVLANVSLSQNLTGDPNTLGVLWSLPVEVQMYLFLPACFLVARRRFRDVAMLWIAFVAAGIFVVFADVRGAGRLRCLVMDRASWAALWRFLCFGAVLAPLYRLGCGQSSLRQAERSSSPSIRPRLIPNPAGFPVSCSAPLYHSCEMPHPRSRVDVHIICAK